MTRCKNGTRKNKKTGNCEKNEILFKKKHNSTKKKDKMNYSINKVNNIDELVIGKQYLISYNDNSEMGLGIYAGFYGNIKKNKKLKFKKYSKIFIEDDKIIRYYGLEANNDGEQKYILKGKLETHGLFIPNHDYYLIENEIK
jgi:hypothetical protein